jgi:D-alanyl-D-alanine carboxypeptidase/D-alanyl-D-alanine-endopeptidase (penicillin-binding protein 4)
VPFRAKFPRRRAAALRARLCVALLCLALTQFPVSFAQTFSPSPLPLGGRGDESVPQAVKSALAAAGIADEGSAIAVVPLDGGALQIAHHDEVAFSPASTMKLLTTFAALSELGPSYRWHTQVYASQAPVHGRIDGDLILRGGGDPSLVIERLWLLVHRLRGLGIQEIGRDLVIDRSRYAPSVDASPSLDGNDLRPYNVAPDAMLINYKAVSLDFVPDRAAHVARIVATPALEGVRIPAQVPLSEGSCGDWKEKLRGDFATTNAASFRGHFPASCGEKTWHVSILTPDRFALDAFRNLWHAAGGTLKGGVREGRAGPGAVLITDFESPELAEVIRDINKNSNNVMARQVFLTFGAEYADPFHEAMQSPLSVPGGAPAPEPASQERSIQAMHDWLARQGLAMPELVLENGSGLSRHERIAAGNLARLLVQAWKSSEMPNFLSSLPEAGVDGTMKDRTGAARAAYIKTGYLSGVRAIAGYVFASSGHHYVVVAIVNDAHADAAQAAHDELLNWIWKEG